VTICTKDRGADSSACRFEHSGMNVRLGHNTMKPAVCPVVTLQR